VPNHYHSPLLHDTLLFMHNQTNLPLHEASENWDDLRFVLAVADCGTVSAAARALGVNHATVLRRIAAFEARHGAALFEKSHNGYRVPPDRVRVLEALRDVQVAVLATSRLMQGGKAPLRGAIRLTSTDSLCQTILPRVLADIRGAAPDLRFDLFATNAHLELAQLQADITVRPAAKLPDDLFGVTPAQIGFGIYEAVGVDHGGRWLGIGGASARSRPAQWIAETIAPDQIVGAADSFLILREMAASGQGRAVLPCYLGDPDLRLARIHGVLPVMQVPLWVASHVDLADSPRIRVVRDLLATGLAAKAAELLGAPGEPAV
jgi:DNA-binding transcriptional LysR family regulator